MNKRLNTALFVIGATLFNLLVTVLSFLLLLTVYTKFIVLLLPGRVREWSFPLIFLAAITISFFAYRFALKLTLKKINMEKYFEPIFAGKRRKS